MAALTGLSSGGVAIANAHHAPLDRQASWLLAPAAISKQKISFND
jgi:hypothetical protein